MEVTYNEAVNDSNSKKWREAVDSEIQSMYQNQVWYLVDPSKGIVPIGYKWIFKKKIGADGQIDTFKARLVVKGYRQRQGVVMQDWCTTPITHRITKDETMARRS